MKKKMILLSLLASATFCLGGCDLGNGTNNSEKNNENTNINQKENEGKKRMRETKEKMMVSFILNSKQEHHNPGLTYLLSQT